MAMHFCETSLSVFSASLPPFSIFVCLLPSVSIGLCRCACLFLLFLFVCLRHDDNGNDDDNDGDVRWGCNLNICISAYEKMNLTSSWSRKKVKEKILSAT